MRYSNTDEITSEKALEAKSVHITDEYFGATESGREVRLIKLSSGDGSYVSLINYGAAIQAIVVPDRNGDPVDVCLGYGTIGEYEANKDYMGATIGRCANRIGGSAFTLNGKRYEMEANDGPNHLHGGFNGFDKRVFDYETDDCSVTFSHASPDGEEGYPGNLGVSVKYTFTETHELSIEYEAKCDQDTLVNLTNHSYFNLSGEGSGSILDHELKLFSSEYTQIDGNCVPTGRILQVSGTPFDFTDVKAIGRDIESPDDQLANGSGYDHHYFTAPSAGFDLAGSILSGGLPGEADPAAILYSPVTGIEMEVRTTKPGLQFYSGNFMHETPGKTGTYARRTGLCLETQFVPNAINDPGAPSPVLKKGDVYRHWTQYMFHVKR